jgi:hypothetical protein
LRAAERHCRLRRRLSVLSAHFHPRCGKDQRARELAQWSPKGELAVSIWARRGYHLDGRIWAGHPQPASGKPDDSPRLRPQGGHHRAAHGRRLHDRPDWLAVRLGHGPDHRWVRRLVADPGRDRGRPRAERKGFPLGFVRSDAVPYQSSGHRLDGASRLQFPQTHRLSVGAPEVERPALSLKASAAGGIASG